MPIYFRFFRSRRTLCTAAAGKIYAGYICIILAKRTSPKFATPFSSEKANDSPCHAEYHIDGHYNIYYVNYHFPPPFKRLSRTNTSLMHILRWVLFPMTILFEFSICSIALAFPYKIYCCAPTVPIIAFQFARIKTKCDQQVARKGFDMQWFLQDISIGKNLKRLRKQFGYSQSDLVTKLHLMGSYMSRSTYSKVESGSRNIRISDFLALKQIYDVDFSEFFAGLLPDKH